MSIVTSKKYKLVWLFCLVFLSLHAKTFTKQIEWTTHERLTDSIRTHVMGFAGALYNEHSHPISQHTCTNTTNQSKYTIHTLSSEIVPQEFTQNIDTATIGTAPQLQVESNNGITTVNVLPIFKENGTIKRLTRYQIEASKLDATETQVLPRHQYKEESILSSGKFVKIRVPHSGVYKLTYEVLASWGLNPAQIRIFGYGGAVLNENFNSSRIDDLPEVPFYIHMGGDNTFGKGDYILFHAQGPVSWSYLPNKYTYTHSINTYSTHGYYFITSDSGLGKHLNTTSSAIIDTESCFPISSFDDYQLHEQELFSALDPTGSNGGGQAFFGEQLNSGNTSFSTSFTFPNIVEGAVGKIKTQLAAASTIAASHFSLTVNGQQEKTISVSAMQPSIYVKGILSTNTHTFNITNNKIDIKLQADLPSDGKAYLNYVEIHVARQLIMDGDAMYFRTKANIGSGKNNCYILKNASPDVHIWNITHLDSIYRVPATYNNNTLQFVGTTDELQQYVAVRTSSSQFNTPEFVGQVKQQNLHALKNVEYVIICPEAFRSEAERLAIAHEEQDGLSWIVASDEEVYNEFSSGTPDASAYRWFMKMLYDRHLAGISSIAPQYLLLMGDGTFDNRKLLHNSGPNTLLSYQSALNIMDETFAYPTDDYFGFLDDTDDNEFKETQMFVRLGIGRLPVSTIDQAHDVVNKLIAYMQENQQGNWRSQLCFLADDGDRADHMISANKIADTISVRQPNYLINKIILDSYLQEVTAAGETYPIAKNKFDNQLRNGLLYLCYMGHGSPTAITNENMMTIESIKNMRNKYCGVWGFGTCSFSHWDAQTISAGEAAVLNPQGGAIGVFSAARTVYADANERLLMEFSKNLFKKENGKFIRIGDVVRLAKNAPNREANRMAYLYLGDPALRIAHPTPYTVQTDSINAHAALTTDTLRALSVNTIKGSIINSDGHIAKEFNGKTFVTIFDKEQELTTLNNHNEESAAYPFHFKDRISILFKGNVDVTNGQFEVTFMLPKDIQYNYGTGKIYYYALDTIHHTEGLGHFEDFFIGGSDPNAQFEDKGPDVDIYLNTLHFVSGGQVDEQPLFIAYIDDPNGINTSGSGIGHDLQLTVDNNNEQTWNLNEAFVSTNGSFRSGSIHYRMSALEEGKHSLRFRAWDLLNNSTTKELDFEVVKGLAPKVYQLITYPNPAKSGEVIHFVFDHDRPSSVLETTLNIFDVSGRKIYSTTQQGGEHFTFIPNKASIGAGIYLYQFQIKTAESEITTQKSKIIITQQ